MPARKMPLQEDHVTLGRGFCLSHVFHLLLGAGKGAIFPFLPLFFRQLGLSATQLGLVLGVKAIMWLWCSPTWTACAKWCNKKKFVLSFSLLTLTFSTLLLTLVPPADPEFSIKFCEQDRNSSILDELFGGETNAAVVPPGNDTEVLDVLNGTTTMAAVAKVTEKLKTQPTTTTTTTTVTTTTASTTTTITTTTPAPTEPPATKLPATQPPIEEGGEEVFSFENARQRQAAIETLSQEMNVEMSTFDDMTDEEIYDVLLHLYSTKYQTSAAVSQKKSRGKRTITFSALEKMREEWGLPASHETFVFVIALILVGELFSAPVDKLADDCWFEYLDIIDELERYGSHRAWSVLGLMLSAPIVGIAVNVAPCFILHGMPRFFIHFFVFTGIMLFVFVNSIGFPVSQGKKTPKRTRLGKGLRVICADAHAASLSVTILFMGAIYATLQALLWWRVQDLHGSEAVIGVAVAAASFSELLIFPLRRWLIKHISSAGAVALALTVTAGQLIFYSFMWNPWLVVGAAGFHGLTFPLIWSAVESYPDFRINPFVMDRSALAVLNALYNGLGAAGGIMLGGYLYDKVHFPLLMQGSAIFLAVWCMIFLGLSCCVKKPQKLRYAKLLQDERSPDSDDDENTIYEDDWLEVAMQRDGR